MSNQKGRKHVRHGETVGGVWTKEFRAYHCMRTRVCRAEYRNRNIGVCERWQGVDGFVNFLSDVGRAPGPEYTVERVDNNLGYSPSNVVWADRVTQMRNTSYNLNFTIDGVTQCLAAWCEEYGVSYFLVYARVTKHGWDIVDALTTPVRGRKAA